MIHRTRQGKAPSGGAKAGRQIVQLGDWFVEYSGDAPDQAELDAHHNPPRPETKAPPEPAGTTVAQIRGELAALRQAIIDAGFLTS